MKKILCAALVCYTLTLSGCLYVRLVDHILYKTGLADAPEKPGADSVDDKTGPADAPEESGAYSVDVFKMHPDDFYFVMEQYPDRSQRRDELSTNVNSSFEATQKCYADLKALSLENVETKHFSRINELTAYYFRELFGVLVEFDNSYYYLPDSLRPVRGKGNFLGQKREPSSRPDTEEVYVIYYFEQL
jgi:hypothetical protein